MLSGCPSVNARASVRSSGRACFLLERYITKLWMEFHRTLVADVVEATEELIRPIGFEG